MQEIVCEFYCFQETGVTRFEHTHVAVAPHDKVTFVYGSTGLFGLDGLSAAFNGAVFFKNDETGECFSGVWGKRNVSRFQSALKKNMTVVVCNKPPPARLMLRAAMRC